MALALFLGSFAPAVFAQTINNTGAAGYTDPDGNPVTVNSNAVGVTVTPNLTATKAFAPTPIVAGATSTLTITLANPGTTALTGVTFTDTFPTSPAAMVVAATANAANTCGGTLTDNTGGALAAGDAGLRLVGVTLPAGGGCSVSVDVTAPTDGTYTNTIPAGAIASVEGASNAADVSAALTVGQNLTATKSFAPNPIGVGAVTTLTITLSNPNATPLTSVAFTDTYPAQIANSATPGGANTCGGAVTAAAGGGRVALAGGSIAAGGSCTVTVDVTSSTGGNHLNLIPTGAITTAQGATNATNVSATLNVQVAASPATVTFYQYAPGAPGAVPIRFDGGGYNGDLNDQPGGTNDQNGASFTALPQATDVYGNPLDTNQPLLARETEVYHAGEPVLFTLSDANRNLDPAVREFVNVTLTDPVTGDSEIVRMQETGPNTGVFAAVIQSVGPDQPAVDNDGRISVRFDTALQVDYADPTDPLDVVMDMALVDPFGVLFDSVSGLPVNGGTITILNADTGQPAQVFGDDGISSHPSTLTFGGGAVDSSGAAYDFPDGGYRFPFVMPGNYVYVIAPPPGYVVPSSNCTLANTAACPLDPNAAPYSVVQGSFGDVFVVMPGPALNIDIPADPPADPLQDLLLQKTSSRTEVSAGDFLQYTLSLQNRGAAIGTTVTVTDTLPAGFRYQAGSLRVAGVAVADPAVSADAGTLTIAVGPLGAAPATVQIQYVVQVAAGAARREAINRATADDDGVAGGRFSNTAQVAVRVREPLLSGAYTIVGRVLESCGTPEPVCPVPAAATRGAPTRSYTVRAQFDSGQDTLKAEGIAELDTLAAKLKGRAIERIELIGHTDSQRMSAKTAARFSDNYGLSKARATVVGEYLARKLGLSPSQVGASGKGPDEPVAGNDSAAGMAKNRRTEVLVYEKGATVAAAPLACEAAVKSATDGKGIANVRVLLDDGTYVATDRDGMYHFEGVRQGTRVVQIDLDSLAPGLQVVPRIQNSRFAGRAYSQFVDVRGGGLWRSDFHVCPAGAQVGLKLATRRGVPALGADAVRQFTVRANFDSGRDTLKAQGEADLNGLAARLLGLDIERIEVIGHTDNQPLGAKTAARFGDNYGLSKARATAVGSSLAARLGLAPEQVQAFGKGPDEPVAPNSGAASMAKNRRTEVVVYQREKGTTAVDANLLRHRIDVDGGGVPVKNLRVTAMLPEGATYVPGSAQLEDKRLDDPQVDGSVATFRVGDVGANWQRRIEFDTRVAPAPAPAAGPASYTLRAQFDSGKATLKPEGQADVNALVARLKGIDIARIELVGHTDSQRVGNPETLRLFKDNHGLSEARARAIGEALAVGLGLAPEQVSATGRGPDQPVASNATPAGRARNRRTEVIVHPRQGGAPAAAACVEAGTIKVLATFDAETQKNQRTPAAQNQIPCVAAGSVPEGGAVVTSERGAASVKGTLVKETPEEIAAKQRKRQAIKTDVEAAGGDRDWLAGATPGIEWLYPEANQSPRAPATRIVIKHQPGQTVVLKYVDGEAVHPLTFDGTKTSADGRVTVSVWRGVPLTDGDNRLEAVVIERDGTVVQHLERVVHYANSVARVEFVPAESVLVADGIHPPVVAIRVLDREGKPVRAGVSGGYRINSPFMPRQTLEQMQQRQLAGIDRFEPAWRVEGDDGIAYIELQPTTESGEAVLSFSFQTQATGQLARRQEIRTWVAAAPRDWLLVGFVEGTVGYNTLKDNVSALPAGTEDEVYTDGEGSFYAKGRVAGEWLLTMAYDSSKPGELERRRSLLSTIDPNEYYTLYGDGAEQRYDAPSQAKLYLKIERQQFYALFGDYNTGLTVTQLSRYSRTLNGIKSELGGPGVVYTAFAAETAQNFARDELRGNGTSGLYRLTRRGIVLNSEKIRIETRDRLRSEQVVDTRYLARHLDYDIDYANGTLFFRGPVPSRDTDFNPVLVVAEYETFGAGEEELAVGGRFGVNLLDGRLSAGVSAIREEQFLGEADLAGADLKLRVGQDTEIRVEGAASDGQTGTIEREGDAWLAEVEHHSGKVDALVYARRQEPGFGLNQQNASEAGTEKLGADLGYHFTPQVSVQGQAYRQEYMATEATRDVGNARVQYRDERNTLNAGVQVAQDEAATGATFESRQATFGASRNFLDRALELSASGDVGLGGRNESLDFPSRYQFGASYALTKNARLLATQEYTDGDAFDTSTTRVGLEATPWQGARLNSTLNQSAIGEYGARNFAQMGLTQALLLGQRWGADFSVDSSRTFNESGQPAFVFNPNQPAAVTGGTLTDDFVALSAGLTYRSELWSWNARAELRDGSTSERYGLTTAWLRQATAGIAVSASLQGFQTDLSSGTKGRYGHASLSGAWRPLGSRWSVLDRLEFKYDELDAGTGLAPVGGELFGNTTLNVVGDATSRRLVNNLNVNRVSHEWTEQDRQGNLFRLEQRNQWSLYYGAKYTFDNYGGVAYKGYTDLLGVEWRYDLTRRWDLGLQASSLNSWSNRTHQYSAGPQIGWSPVTNGWISLGYNLIGFHDRDFDAARYTAEGPYLKLRFKFDQNTRMPGRDRKDPRAMEWDEYAAGPGKVGEVPADPVAAQAESAAAPLSAQHDADPTDSAVPATAGGDAAGMAVGGYAVSVATVATRAQAEDYTRRLAAAGYTPAVVPAPNDGVHHVLALGFESEAAAAKAAAALRRQIQPTPEPRAVSTAALETAARAAAVATVAPAVAGAPAAALPVAFAAANPAAGAGAPATDLGGYAISVWSLREHADALAYAERLRAAGYRPFVERTQANGLTWSRVLLPGYTTVASTAEVLKVLRARFPDATPWVVPADWVHVSNFEPAP